MAQNITLMGASYSAVPAVRLPKTGGGTADFTDVSDTTAGADDVASGKYFYTAAGVKTEGTASGGGSDVLVVTLSYDEDLEYWTPDCTYADIVAAYQAGHDIVARTDSYLENEAVADCVYYEGSGEEGFIYSVNYLDGYTNLYQFHYMTALGIEAEEPYAYIVPNFDSRTVNITPTAQAQTQTITPRAGYNGLEEVIINVAAGGGGNDRLVTLASLDMGVISTSSTTATDTGKTISVSDVTDYDLLIVETSRNAVANSRHMATVGLIYLYNNSDITTKSTAAVLSYKMNFKTSSTGVFSTRQGTTSYGIYPNSCTLTTSNGKTSASIPMYQRYNSTSTGQISGSYTARVYGVKLFDLIGG